MSTKKWMAAAALAVAAVCLGQMAALAADIGVTDWAGVIAANPGSGDRVVFAAGTYTVTQQVELKSGVTYVGAGPGATIIDGGAALRAFTAWGDRSLDDGTAGTSDNTPDPFINTSGPKGWVIEGMTVQNCRADAVNRTFTAGPDPLNPLVGSTVTDPDKDFDGGAMVISNGATGTIRNCEFKNNACIAAGGDGGAIQIDGLFTDVTIDNCLFDGDTTGDAGDTGGAIRLESGRYEDNAASNLTVANSIFRNNTSPRSGQDGGAIRLGGELQTFTARNCLFENNGAADDGGCIFQGNNLPGLQVIENCVFVGNSTGDDDVIQFRGLSRSINCTFINNDAADQAVLGHQGQAQDGNNDGTIDFVNGEPDNISYVANCIFIGNKYGDGGDALIRARLATVDGVANTPTAVVQAFNNIHFNNLSQPTNANDNTLIKSGHATVETGTLNVDPQINLTNFAPNAGSRVIGAALASDAPADDFNGAIRDSSPDIGAVEFSAGEGEGEGEGEPGNRITANVYPPFIDEGTVVILTGPAGTDFQWKKNSVDIDGANNLRLVFDPVEEADAGVYTVQYNNGAKVVVLSEPFNLIVNPEGSVPVAGFLGLVALAGACGLGGARLIRRRA